MNKLIMRSSNSQERFFPPIEPSLYGPANSDQNVRDSAAQANLSHAASAPEAILELANHKLTRWQLWTGRGLDPERQLGRLLRLHSRLLDDELKGRWRRADFYWREILRALRQLDKRASVWENLDECFDLESHIISKHTGELRHRVIVELFIDANIALFNGRLRNSKDLQPDDRAFIFAARTLELLPFTNMEETERWQISESVADIQIQARRDHGQIQQALKICENMAHEFPDRCKYQDLIVEMEAQRALKGLLNSEDPADNMSDARRLEKTIDALEKLSKTYPFNPGIYETLGLLNQVRAVKLANGGELSQALLAIEESLAYDPTSTQAVEIRNQLRESMSALKAQVSAVEAQIASRPGTVLSEEGRRLKREANKGVKSADRFIESGRAAKLSRAAQQARAVRIWRLAGLGGADDQVTVNATKLYEMLPALFDGSQANLETLKNRIADVTKDIPGFDALKQDLLLGYLAQQLFPAADSEAGAETQNVYDPPVLEPRAAQAVSSKEPAGMWIFSREGLAAKALAVVTLAGMLVSGAMAGWYGYGRHLRDQAYIQLIAAVHSGKEQRVLDAVEEFVSLAGSESDARLKHVLSLREQARTATESPQMRALYKELIEAVRAEDLKQIVKLTERFQALASKTPDDPRLSHANQLHDQARDITERANRDEAYKLLAQAVLRQDLPAATAAAKTFLALPRNYSDDPRTDQVRDFLNKARELPNQWVRDDAYKELIAALNAGNPDMVMNAAETFLSAPPVQMVDSRQEQVMDAYSRAFVSWFIGLSDPAAPSARQRIRAYRALAAVN